MNQIFIVIKNIKNWFMNYKEELKRKIQFIVIFKIYYPIKTTKLQINGIITLRLSKSFT